MNAVIQRTRGLTMRRLFLLCLFLPGLIYAQTNPCNVPDPKVTKLYTDWQTSGQVTMSCSPAPLGTGTLPVVRYNESGVAAWTWCPAGTSWRLIFSAATWTWLKANPGWVADYAQATTATDKPAAMAALATKYVSTPMADPTLTPVWCPFVKEMYASKPADVPTPPPVATHVVAQLIAGVTSVATYKYTAPSTLTWNAERATVGQACDCQAVKYQKSSQLYCAVAGRQVVALCKIKP